MGAQAGVPRGADSPQATVGPWWTWWNVAATWCGCPRALVGRTEDQLGGLKLKMGGGGPCN